MRNIDLLSFDLPSEPEHHLCAVSKFPNSFVVSMSVGPVLPNFRAGAQAITCHSERSEPTPFLHVRSCERVGSRREESLFDSSRKEL